MKFRIQRPVLEGLVRRILDFDQKLFSRVRIAAQQVKNNHFFRNDQTVFLLVGDSD